MKHAERLYVESVDDVERGAIVSRKPESFDFLGFTYYIGKARNGAFKVGMKTSRKKLNAKLKEMTQGIKGVRNLLPLKAKLSGHFQYFGVSGNYREVYKYGFVRGIEIPHEAKNVYQVS